MGEVVLVVHYRNILDVLLTSGKVVERRCTIKEARKCFIDSGIRFFAPKSNMLVACKYIDDISKQGELLLSKKILALIKTDFKEKITHITVSRRRKTEFRKMKKAEAVITGAVPADTTCGTLQVHYDFIARNTKPL